jgi:hypothetical protein
MDAMAQDHRAVDEILQVRSQIRQLQQRLHGDAAAQPVLTAATAIDHKADVIENVLYQSQAKTNEELLNFPTELNSKIAYLEDEVDYGDGAPTVQFQQMAQEYLQQLQQQLTAWRQLKQTGLAALNRQMEQDHVPVIYVKPTARE